MSKRGSVKRRPVKRGGRSLSELEKKIIKLFAKYGITEEEALNAIAKQNFTHVGQLVSVIHDITGKKVNPKTLEIDDRDSRETRKDILEDLDSMIETINKIKDNVKYIFGNELDNILRKVKKSSDFLDETTLHLRLGRYKI